MGLTGSGLGFGLPQPQIGSYNLALQGPLLYLEVHGT